MMWVFTEKFADFAFWIVKITKVHTACWTNRNAGRVKAFFDAVHTEGAFVHISFWMHVTSIVGA